MKDRISFEDCRLLAAFADYPTLRDVAHHLGIPRATVSRRLQGIEVELGYDLFLRNGRRLVPTRLGKALVERCAATLDAYTEAQSAALGGHALDRRFTVAASPLFAELVLPLVLPDMVLAHPEFTWELKLGHDYSDLFAGEVDVALRRGPLPNSGSLTARKLGRLTLICVAAPSDPAREALDDEEGILGANWIRIGAELAPFRIDTMQGRGRQYLSVMPRIAVDSQPLAIALVPASHVSTRSWFARS